MYYQRHSTETVDKHVEKSLIRIASIRTECTIKLTNQSLVHMIEKKTQGKRSVFKEYYLFFVIENSQKY